MLLKSPITSKQILGFSLIEVLISLVIISIGILGIVKIQALSLSNSKYASIRTLLAIQVRSLTSSMHANKAFWSVETNPPSFTAEKLNVTSSSLGTVPSSCNSCLPRDMAAYDVNTWVTSMNQLFPGYKASVKCTALTPAQSAAGGAPAIEAKPATCDINVSWTENYIGLDKTSTGQENVLTTFDVVVQP